MSAPLPTIALIGAPGTGAAALTRELQQRVAADAARFVCTTATEDCTGAALTLLMGLDLPCAAPEQARREACDAHLRALLADAAVRYHVVYGQGPERVENALNAINSIAVKPYAISSNDVSDAKPMRLRAWDCEKCSDPECEHRLFSALTGRGAAGR